MTVRIAGQAIKMTPEHPIFVVGIGWVTADNLATGDELLGHDGRSMIVDGVEPPGPPTIVYNLQVSEFHTFFVGCIAWGFSVWVHNESLCDLLTELKNAATSNARKARLRKEIEGRLTNLSDEDAKALKDANLRNALDAEGVGLPEYYVAKHNSIRPRPTDTHSHHGVMSAWMRNNFRDYDANVAPTVYMSAEMHKKTWGVFNKWQAEMEKKMGGVFDWTKVSEADMRALSEKMFDAAGVPAAIRTQYWAEFDRMMLKLNMAR